MSGIAWLRSRNVEVGWFAFAGANVAAMVAWPSWETIPFHFVWISLTIVYGFRVWKPKPTAAILGVIIVVTGASIMADAFEGIQLWGELFEVPLMSAMFLAMVWHARRRQTAVEALEGLLERQEQFLNDISHELRTPVTIAQGHLELLQRHDGDPAIAIALDELGRIERIIARLLLLAKTGHATFLAPTEIDVEQFLEDIFVRWSEVAPRSWRLGPIVHGTIWGGRGSLARRNGCAGRERGQVHGRRGPDRASRKDARLRARDRCDRRWARDRSRQDRANLRTLRARRRRAQPSDRRRRPRSRDRAGGRRGARRLVRRRVAPGPHGLLPATPELPARARAAPSLEAEYVSTT